MDAVVVSEAWMREDTLLEKECLVARLSLVVIDLGLPALSVIRLFSWFNTDSERSALCKGRWPFVKTGRGGDACGHSEVVGVEVYGTAKKGVDVSQGPMLSLGKIGLLIRRVISVKARRADERERASNSALDVVEYLDVYREGGVHWDFVREDRKLLGVGREESGWGNRGNGRGSEILRRGEEWTAADAFRGASVLISGAVFELDGNALARVGEISPINLCVLGSV